MTTAYTSLLGLALPVTGELSGTWGDTVNNSITSLLDTAVAGTTTLSTDGDVTLTTTTGASNQARQAILLCSGARTALRTITAPAQSKIYTIINATTGGFSVKIVGVGPTTGVTVTAGESVTVAWNGSDFVKVSSNSVFGNVTVSNLTDTALTAGRVTFAGTGGLLSDSANLFWDNSNAYFGVGTNTPNRKVNIVGVGASGISTSNPSIRFDNTASGRFGLVEVSSNQNLYIWNSDSGSGSTVILRGSGGGTETGRFDGAGNLGLNRVPSAWGTDTTAIQLGGSTFSAIAAEARLIGLANCYWDGTNWRYLNNGTALQYRISAGTTQFEWYVGASGTAGGIISTGFTTPGMTFAANNILTVTSPTSTNAQFSLVAPTYDTFNLTVSGSALTYATVSSTAQRWTISGTEVGRFDSSGRLLVGTNTYTVSSSEKFEVYGGMTLLDINSDSVGTLYVKNRSTTSATIQPYIYFSDSGGNRAGFGVKTSDAAFHQYGQGGINWYTGSAGYSGLAATLDTSGNLLLGSSGTASQQLTFYNSTGGLGMGWGGTTANYTNIFGAYSSGALVLAAGVQGSRSSDAYTSSYGGSSMYRSIIRLDTFNGSGIQFFTNGSSTVARDSGYNPSDRGRVDPSGNWIFGDTATQYSALLYVNGAIAARNGGVDGTFQNAFVAGYTSNYTEKNIIQTAVSSAGSGSGFRFQVSNGAGSSGVTTAMDIVRSQINLYASGSIIANIQSQGFYMSGGNWIYWDKSGTRSWQMYCNQTNANMILSSGDSLGTIQLVSSAVQVSGSLSKGSGSFRIEHPLPELAPTHQLVHSFIEGPQADLIYRGKANLVNGTATINIDQAAGMTEGTFVVLCRDVQCFTTNESDWTAVRGSVSGNILTIEAQDNTSTASISWMVIGERQDKHMYETEWTDDNGKVIVEPLKPQ